MSDQYLLSEPWGSDEYARQLAAKSGQDPDRVLALIRQMRKAETSNQLSEADLQHLSRQIDECILHPESNDP